MRKFQLRISPETQRLADSQYRQQAIEIDRGYSHVKVDELTYHMMNAEGKSAYFRIYAQRVRQKVGARLKTYLDAFREENVIPDDADLSQMSWSLKDVVDDVTAHLPEELKKLLNQFGEEQIIANARRDIDIFAQKMSLRFVKEQARQPSQPSVTNYNINILENRGPIQQAGNGNIQTTTGNKDEIK